MGINGIKTRLMRVLRYEITALDIMKIAGVCLLLTALLRIKECGSECFKTERSSYIRPAPQKTAMDTEQIASIRNTKVNQSAKKKVSKRLPQCIVIGVRKGGTRALLTYLDLHPDIVTAPQEIHFFSKNSNYARGLKYYKSLMPYSLGHQITIEKTPAYFVSMKAVERIYKMNSSIRILLTLRDPITRLISDYTHQIDKSIQKQIKLPPFKTLALDNNGQVNEEYWSVQWSLYYKHFTKWLALFKPEQIHIVDGDMLIKDPYSEMYKVETFLGIAHDIKREMFHYNKGKGFFCVKQDEEDCLAKTKGRKHIEVDANVIDKLKTFYKKPNNLFFKMANRTFDWQ